MKRKNSPKNKRNNKDYTQKDSKAKRRESKDRQREKDNYQELSEKIRTIKFQIEAQTEEYASKISEKIYKLNKKIINRSEECVLKMNNKLLKTNKKISSQYKDIENSIIKINNLEKINIGDKKTLIVMLDKLQTEITNLKKKKHSIRLWTITDKKETGSHGGTAYSGTWEPKILNNLEASNAGSDVELIKNENSFRLKPGTYRIEINTSFFRTGNTIARLQCVNNEETIISTPNLFVTTDPNANTLTANLFTIVQVTVPQKFQLQYQCSHEQLNTGLGVACNFPDTCETYTQIQIEKLYGYLPKNESDELNNEQLDTNINVEELSKKFEDIV